MNLFPVYSLSYVGGQLVDVGLGQKMHLLCKGHGKPVGNAPYEDSIYSI